MTSKFKEIWTRGTPWRGKDYPIRTKLKYASHKNWSDWICKPVRPDLLQATNPLELKPQNQLKHLQNWWNLDQRKFMLQQESSQKVKISPWIWSFSVNPSLKWKLGKSTNLSCSCHRLSQDHSQHIAAHHSNQKPQEIWHKTHPNEMNKNHLKIAT